MPEWTVCPHCSLKHSRRPDGICPRCREAVGEPPPAGGLEADGPAPGGPAPLPQVYDGRPLGGSTLFESTRPPERGTVNLGARIAGGIMVANGLALLIETGLSATLRDSGGGSFRPSPVGMLLDLVIGGWLLTGNPKVLPWAKVRVVLGALVFPAVFFSSGQTFLGGLQVAYSAGLALLLFGDPGSLRIGAGLLATGFGLALETIGLFGMATGTAPLAHVMMAPGLESGGPVASVEGTACPYRLSAAGGHWYLRKAEAARKENPLADRWIVWPEKDAHVLVIAEQVEPGLSVDMEKFAEVVLGNARQASKDLNVLEQDPLPGGGTRLHTQATINGLAIESYYGLYAREPWIFQVVAFTGRPHFASVQGDLEAIVASFEGPDR